MRQYATTFQVDLPYATIFDYYIQYSFALGRSVVHRWPAMMMQPHLLVTNQPHTIVNAPITNNFPSLLTTTFHHYQQQLSIASPAEHTLSNKSILLLNIKCLNDLNNKFQSTSIRMQPIYGQTPYRFAIITSFMLALLASLLPASNFAAITSLIEDRFQIAGILVSLNFVLIPIARCGMSLPVNWIITKQGIRFSFFLSAVCSIAGSWLRVTLSTSNPYLCLCGSFLTGIGAMILVNSISRVAVEWFRAEILSFVAFPCVMTAVLSQTLSIILPGLFLSSTSTAEDITAFLRLIAIIVTGPPVLLMIVFAIKGKPQIPPSKSAKAEKNIISENYFRVLKQLFKNKNYLLVMLVLCLTSGPLNPFQSSLDKTLIGLGYSQPSHVITVAALSMLIFGLIGNQFYALWLKKTNKFRLISICMNGFNFLGFAVINLGLILGLSEIWQIGLMSSLFGFSYGAHNPFFYVYATQIAFPVDQASILGYLTGVLEFFGFALSMLYVLLVDQTRSNAILLNGVATAMMFVGFVLTLFIKQDLRKDKFQQEKEYVQPLLDEQTQQKQQETRQVQQVTEKEQNRADLSH